MTMSVNSLPGQESDVSRTERLFVGFLNSIVGPDNSYAGQDAVPYGSNGQFYVANPDGSMSVLGQPRSNLQGTIKTGVPPLLILAGIGLFAWMLVKRKL